MRTSRDFDSVPAPDWALVTLEAATSPDTMTNVPVCVHPVFWRMIIFYIPFHVQISLMCMVVDWDAERVLANRAHTLVSWYV